MKLLIITPGKLPVPATSGGAVETLIQILIDKNEKDKKHDITVVSVYTEEAKIESQKYKNTKFNFIDIDDKLYRISRLCRYIINRIPYIYIGNAFINRVYKFLKNNKEKYDYVIIENAPQYSLILKKLYKDNLIFHSHNDFLNNKVNMSKKILNSYNKVFSLSNYINERIGQIDEKYKKIYTLYNGVDTNKFDIQEDTNLRKKLGIKKDEFIYLYTGRIVKEKGVKELIESFNKIKDNNSKLIVVGDLKGDIYTSKKYIKEILNSSKNNKNIIFTGKVKYKDIPKYYKISNIGIIPSVWEEPFALTVIEHMAVGNPVIVSNSGAIPELVNKKCAIIVDKNHNYVDNLHRALVEIKNNYSHYNHNDIIEQANKFNSDKYWSTFNKLLNK